MASGKKINWNKQDVFFFNTKLDKQREIIKMLGFKSAKILGWFLGTPLFLGAYWPNLWTKPVDSYLGHMEGWKSKLLALVGLILMLRSVIYAIPIFLMMCLKIPTKIIILIEQKMRKFFQNGNHDQNNILFLALDKICKLKSASGASLQN